LDHRRSHIPTSVTAIRAPGNGRGTDIGFERRPVPGEARRIAANIAKLPDLLGSRRDETSQGEKMQKWEYNLLVQNPNTECVRCEEALNGLGRDGWELVTFYVNGAGDNVFVLKKPKEQ
jgi:hypothetical protein